MSLVGVGLGLWITDTPQSAPALLGVILLAGIVVNNSILLVVSGMFFSMALSMLVVPGAHVGMNRFAERCKGWIVGRRGAEDDAEPVVGRRPPEPAAARLSLDPDPSRNRP